MKLLKVKSLTRIRNKRKLAGMSAQTPEGSMTWRTCADLVGSIPVTPLDSPFATPDSFPYTRVAGWKNSTISYILQENGIAVPGEGGNPVLRPVMYELRTFKPDVVEADHTVVDEYTIGVNGVVEATSLRLAGDVRGWSDQLPAIEESRAFQDEYDLNVPGITDEITALQALQAAKAPGVHIEKL